MKVNLIDIIMRKLGYIKVSKFTMAKDRCIKLEKQNQLLLLQLADKDEDIEVLLSALNYTNSTLAHTDEKLKAVTKKLENHQKNVEMAKKYDEKLKEFFSGV